MSEAALWKAVADVARELAPTHVERLARRVEGMDAPSALGPQGPPSVDTLEAAWRGYRLPAAVLAGALRGAAAVARDHASRESSELVWTGPATTSVPMRLTETVLVDLLRTAVREIYLVSFVAYEVPSVVLALNDAIRRGVRISVLLETSAARGGRLDVDSIARIRGAVPGALFYVWTDATDGSGLRGAVHAKCVVVDGAACLITSANITAAALERNMELGVLVRGGRLPERLAAHFRSLIERRVLQQE